MLNRDPVSGTRRPGTRAAFVFAAACLGASAPSRAAAAEPVAARPNPEPSEGFQMAASTGLVFPAGSASGEPGDRLSRRYSYQWPLGLELGVKMTPALYLGAYFGVAIGAEGDDARLEAYCDDDDSDLENDIGCSAVSLNAGLEVRYSLAPAARYNPWLSYGLGFEGTHQSLDDRERGYSEEVFSSGPTWARLGVGFDYRSEVLGFGPYVQAAFGRFGQSTTYVNDDEASRAELGSRSWHTWIAFGTRLVLFP